MSFKYKLVKTIKYYFLLANRKKLEKLLRDLHVI